MNVLNIEHCYHSAITYIDCLHRSSVEILCHQHVQIQLHSCSVQPLASGRGSVEGAFVSAFQDLIGPGRCWMGQVGSKNEIEMCHCCGNIHTCSDLQYKCGT